MGKRVTLEIVLVIVMTLLLAYAVFGAFALTSSTDPVGTFFDQVPRVLFGLLGIGLGLWAIMVVIGAIAHRYRAAGWRIGTHLVSIVVAMIVNSVVMMVVATVSGGELLIAGLAVAAGMVVVVCSVPAILITELLIIRPRKVARPAADATL